MCVYCCVHIRDIYYDRTMITHVTQVVHAISLSIAASPEYQPHQPLCSDRLCRLMGHRIHTFGGAPPLISWFIKPINYIYNIYNKS